MIEHGYRKAVGIFLFNDAGLVWTGQRNKEVTVSSHLYDSKHLWQMPQGGIDEGEDSLQAAKRELFEESGITQTELIKESREWLYYDLPDNLLGKVLQGYRGQKQKWFALRFLGTEDQINLNIHEPPEFIAWRWSTLDQLLSIVVPFKVELYRKVILEFSPYLPTKASLRDD